MSLIKSVTKTVSKKIAAAFITFSFISSSVLAEAEKFTETEKFAEAKKVAETGNGTDKLSTLLERFETFSAQFQQITLSENGRAAEKIEGQLHLAKPNLFRWETKLPFPQEIVSDGQYIWVHDPDLEQVTQRSAETQQTSAPALILNGQIEELAKSYDIRMIGDTESQLFDLVPISDQSNFSRIRLAFTEDTISELMLEDSLGQRTSIVFSEQRVNPEQDESLFFFRVPADADLIVDIEG